VFSESQRVQIRRYLGYSRLNLAMDPRLESVLTTVQSVADGGSFPDSSTEDLIVATLASLVSLESKMVLLWDQAQAVDADGLKIEVPRAMIMLRMEGRRLIGIISDTLEVKPKRDVFSSPGLRPMDATYVASDRSFTRC
jgi:hypothetical protein